MQNSKGQANVLHLMKLEKLDFFNSTVQMRHIFITQEVVAHPPFCKQNTILRTKRKWKVEQEVIYLLWVELEHHIEKNLLTQDLYKHDKFVIFFVIIFAQTFYITLHTYFHFSFIGFP